MQDAGQEIPTTAKSIELAYWQDVYRETVIRSGGDKALKMISDTIKEIEAEIRAGKLPA